MNYLYNGIELPDINEVWTDKETYPYALIRWSTEDDYYLLTVSANKAHYGPIVDWLFCSNLVPYVQYKHLEHWEDKRVISESTGIWPKDKMPVVWSNYDVLNRDGTVYLKASEPIPVGGTPIDPTSMLMGWLVGRQIAGIRKEKHHE